MKGPPLSTFLFSGTRALVTGLLTIVVLLFFLLVSGNSFLRRIVEILPTLHDKKQAVDIINEIQRTVAVYLGTVTVMNAVGRRPHGRHCLFLRAERSRPVGKCCVCAELHSDPRPFGSAILLALVGLTTFDGIWPALLPAGIFLLIHFAEGRGDYADDASAPIYAQSGRS